MELTYAAADWDRITNELGNDLGIFAYALIEQAAVRVGDTVTVKAGPFDAMHIRGTAYRLGVTTA